MSSSSSASLSDIDDAVLNAPWVQADAGLQAWLPEISARHRHFVHTLDTICSLEGSLHDFCFAHGLERFGLQRGVGGSWYREWAPAALGLSLVGDFNGWDASAHPCSRTDDGVWEVFVPNRPDGRPALDPGSRFKAAVRIGDGHGRASKVVLRMPAWARQTVQDVGSGEFSAVVPSSELRATLGATRAPRSRRRSTSTRRTSASPRASRSSPGGRRTPWRRRCRERGHGAAAVRRARARLLRLVRLPGHVVLWPSSPGTLEEPQEPDAAHGYGLLIFFESSTPSTPRPTATRA